MIPKENRINGRLYERLFRVGKRAHSSHFVMIYAANREPKIAFSVGKKVAKKATQRNRIRRQLYAMWQNFTPKPREMAIIFLYKGPVPLHNAAALTPEISSLFSKI